MHEVTDKDVRARVITTNKNNAERKGVGNKEGRVAVMADGGAVERNGVGGGQGREWVVAARYGPMFGFCFGQLRCEPSTTI